MNRPVRELGQLPTTFEPGGITYTDPVDLPKLATDIAMSHKDVIRSHLLLCTYGEFTELAAAWSIQPDSLWAWAKEGQ